MSIIQFDTVLDAASANNVALSQTPSTGFTINGALASGGAVAAMDTHGAARQILFTSVGDESGKTITVTGKVLEGGSDVSETLTGPNTTATTVNYFLTITTITVSSAFAGACTVGTNGVGASPWKAVNAVKNPFQIGIGTILRSGSVNWTVQHTFDKVFDPTVIPVAFDHSSIAAKAANTDGNYAFAVAAVRTKINSGAGTVRSIFRQSEFGW